MSFYFSLVDRKNNKSNSNSINSNNDSIENKNNNNNSSNDNNKIKIELMSGDAIVKLTMDLGDMKHEKTQEDSESVIPASWRETNARY